MNLKQVALYKLHYKYLSTLVLGIFMLRNVLCFFIDDDAQMSDQNVAPRCFNGIVI
jgi:hypothetical protein